jgi:ribosome-associated protein
MEIMMGVGVQEQEFSIEGEYITLGQLIKAVGFSDTGGSVKYFLEETPVTVNGEPDTRRGRKLRPGDLVIVGDEPPIRITEAQEGMAENS